MWEVLEDEMHPAFYFQGTQGLVGVGRGAKKATILAVEWTFQPLNHNKPKCKMFPNNHEGSTPQLPSKCKIQETIAKLLPKAVDSLLVAFPLVSLNDVGFKSKSTNPNHLRRYLTLWTLWVSTTCQHRWHGKGSTHGLPNPQANARRFDRRCVWQVPWGTGI